MRTLSLAVCTGRTWGYRRVHDPETRQLVRIDAEPSTAPFVQEARRRMLEGDSLYAVAADFNRRDVPIRRPKRTEHRQQLGWTAGAIEQMLAMPAYAALRQHRGEIIGSAAWPALIEPEAWHKLQAVRFRPDRRLENP